MIFVTVGAQMPFDRLIESVDQWAGREGRHDVLAQIGDGAYVPAHVRHVRHMDPQTFRATVLDAEMIIAHAGMGSILTALELGKPILVMPRRGDLHETRNDHQVATAQKLGSFGRVSVAMNEKHLLAKLRQMNELRSSQRIGPHASPRLIGALRDFVFGDLPVSAASREVELGLSGADLDLVRQSSGATVLVNG